MASYISKPQQQLLSSISLLILAQLLVSTSANSHSWKTAHATFYGNPDGSGTYGGACGYDEAMEKEIHGVNTAAVSPVLFKDGKKCGACYQIKCAKGTKGCKPGYDSVFVTANNLCPEAGGKRHFDLTQPAFVRIAEHEAGIVPVIYKRVPCKRKGGVRFTVTGNPYYNMVMITNVGGAGDVSKLEVKSGKGDWKSMRRDWGQKWVLESKIAGQALSFRVTTGNGKTHTSKNVAPVDWKYGQTYVGGNFAS